MRTYKGRTIDELLPRVREELGEDAVIALTREAPADWKGHSGRIDAELIASQAFEMGLAFVCGSNGFVEAATGLLMDAGYGAGQIRTERFGPTGASMA